MNTKKLLSVLLTLCMVVGMLPAAALPALAIGSYPNIGSIVYDEELGAYAIGSVDNLSDLAVYVNGSGTYSTGLDEFTAHDCSGMTFKMTSDIFFPHTTAWNESVFYEDPDDPENSASSANTENNFTPIGIRDDDIRWFKGTFDGEDHTISGIRICSPSSGVGLFGYTYGSGVIANVTLTDARIAGNTNVGGIVGSSNTEIENCRVTDTVAIVGLTERSQYFGGIAGKTSMDITGCSTSVLLESAGTFYCAGGIAGTADGTVCDCFSSASVISGGDNIGGILGYSNRGKTERCLAVGVTTVSGNAIVGKGTGTETSCYYLDCVCGGEVTDCGSYHSDDKRVASLHKITFADGVAAVPATIEIDGVGYYAHKAKFTLAYDEDLAPEGYGAPLVGYSVTRNTDGREYSDAFVKDTTLTVPYFDVTVRALWTPETHTITFDTAGGSEIEPITQDYRTDVTPPADPTRTGYTFAGWNRAIPTTMPAEDITVTAVWTPHDYVVIFDANGGQGSMAAQNLTFGADYTLDALAFTRTDYHFLGWAETPGGEAVYADGASVRDLTGEQGGSVTLYARWAPNTYVVHYNANYFDGYDENSSTADHMPDQSFTYDEAAKALSANIFSQTVGTFTGWNTEKNGSGCSYEDCESVRNLTSDDGGVVVLYAQWYMMEKIFYDSDVFSCQLDGVPGTIYRAYPGETIRVSPKSGASVYTIYVNGQNGTAVTFDTETNTFVMPQQPVYITATAVKMMTFVSVEIDDFYGSYDAVYTYDPEHPTVTPTITVTDNGTTLTEGVHYTLSIENNTGSPDAVVTATVTVTGIEAGGYSGEEILNFRISPLSIADCTIGGTREAYDDGYGIYNPLCENVEVWNGDTRLELYEDYEIETDYRDEYTVGQTYEATVYGVGVWSGSQTFEFTVIELSHTIVFVANGGSGEMESKSISNNGAYAGRYYLEDCDFDPPVGKEFDHWEVSCEPGEHKHPGDYFTAPYIFSEYDVQTITVTAHWRDKLYAVDVSDIAYATILVNGVETEPVNGAVGAYYRDRITVVPDEGYGATYFGVTDSRGCEVTVVVSAAGVYSFTMPADDATVSAAFRKKVAYTGGAQACDTVDESLVEWTTGWYAVTADATFEERIEVVGSVNLILCDGVTLTANKGIHVGSGNALTIWVQSGGTGKLNAQNERVENPLEAAIGGNYYESAGSITINGGVINASSGDGTRYYRGSGAAIGGGKNASGGTITINGGVVNASCGNDDYSSLGYAAGIGGGIMSWSGSVRITGGTVDAYGRNGSGIGAGATGRV